MVIRLIKRRQRRPDIPNDGSIDEEIWSRVEEATVAAWESDADTHYAISLTIGELQPFRIRRAEIYMRYLLGNEVHLLLKNEITAAGIRDLALRAAPLANRVVKGTPEVFEEVIRHCLWQPEESDRLRGSEVSARATAILGSLLGDFPREELRSLRSGLEQQYLEHWVWLRKLELNELC